MKRTSIKAETLSPRGFCSRRGFVASCIAAGMANPGRAAMRCADVAATGAIVPGLEPFDELMTSFLAEHKVPGAALAVTRNGRLVYARGFGFADVNAKEPVQPNSLFRIASVSKPITAVAILQLVEKKRLSLEDKVVERMKLTAATLPERKADPRWEKITIRHCLQHTGGWDRGKSYDPIGRAWRIAEEFGAKPPVPPELVVRYMMAQPLDFDPGERYAYSNLGYIVLGRILEATTGQSYERHVQQAVLAPLGIKTMMLGRALAEKRAKGEVKYYDLKSRMGRSLYPPRVGEQVPLQYGAENFEAYEAHGGWIASAIDLVRFSSAFDDPAKCPILGAKTIEEMWARPSGAAGCDKDGKPRPAFYGCGWNVRPIGKAGKFNAWHFGNIAGTRALLVRRWDGLDWAVLFNTDRSATGKSLSDLIDGRLHEAARQVKKWPETNQFIRS
jgi:CubicO group peptidase (beta-lactamase class C family)